MSDNIIKPDDWLDLAKSYFDASANLNAVVNDASLKIEDRIEAYNKSVELIQEGHAFQKIALDAISKDLASDVKEVKEAVEKAKKTIKKIKTVGNMIELAGDLIALAGLLTAAKPASLVALPAVLNEIRDDVARMKNDT